MYLIIKLSLLVATTIGNTAGNTGDGSSTALSSLAHHELSRETKTASFSHQKDSLTVLLDSYFNNEKKKDKAGHLMPTHYKWTQKDDGGYSKWGAVFNQMGAKTETSYDPPSKNTLKNASIYIITDPDIPKENKDAKYMTKGYAEAIARWVARGGVLVMMANDSGNADIQHFNLLAGKFGFQFNEDSYNHVPGRNFDSGAVNIAEGNMIFKQSRRIYIKELSTIKLTGQAQTVLEKNGHIVAVSARYGKGTVFAVGDPWFYNEYVNGRLPDSFENIKAMKELTGWLLLNAGH